MSDRETLLAREKELRKDYPRIVEGSIRREKDGVHKGKLSVVIRCAKRGCPNKRRVATSDLHQVQYCVDCTKEMRAARRRDARKAANGKASAKKSRAKARVRKPAVPAVEAAGVSA